MRLDSVAAFLGAMRQCRLLESDQLDEIERTARGCFPDPLTLAKELVRKGVITPFQVNQLLQGNGNELVLANYVLLERIGEGGMGTVYKAQHRMIGRVVALKVLRRDRLTHQGAVKRFEREIMAAAQLHHPNVVTAYDAGQVGDMHFFTMEYVQGIDLGKLLKEQGRLPIPDACEYIRQAALGLQHAFERGLVHRDIKPSNLFLSTKDSVIKILDLGLARVEEMDSNVPANNLTQEGKVVGTVDYLAPEQAINSHRVDIRADLYSLGCTLYQLLSGRVPFKRGSALEKLARHRWEEPKALEKLRPEIPAPVIAVVRKLMAKKPEDRYATPADLATALTNLAGRASHSSVGIPTAAAVSKTASAAVLAIGDIPTAAPVAMLSPPPGSVPTAEIPGRPPSRPEAPLIDTSPHWRGRSDPTRLLVMAGIGIFVMLVGMVLALMLAARVARGAERPVRAKAAQLEVHQHRGRLLQPVDDRVAEGGTDGPVYYPVIERKR